MSNERKRDSIARHIEALRVSRYSRIRSKLDLLQQKREAFNELAGAFDRLVENANDTLSEIEAETASYQPAVLDYDKDGLAPENMMDDNWGRHRDYLRHDLDDHGEGLREHIRDLCKDAANRYALSYLIEYAYWFGLIDGSGIDKPATEFFDDDRWTDAIFGEVLGLSEEESL